MHKEETIIVGSDVRHLPPVNQTDNFSDPYVKVGVL